MTNGSLRSFRRLLNVTSTPLAPAEPLLGEISATQCHNGRAAGFHYDGRHVVPVWLFRNVGNPAKDAGRPDDLALFANVHGCLGLSDLIARTGFNFDESQCEWPRRFVVGHDVDLARDPAAVSAVADRGDEISGDYPAVLPLAVICDQLRAV